MVEHLYPAHEIIIAIALNMIANFFTLVFNIVFSQDSIAEYGLFIILIILLPVTIHNFLIKTDLNRFNVEKEQSLVNQKKSF